MKKMLPFLTLFFIFGLSLWGFGATVENYLPLKEGMVWEFQHKMFDLKSKDQIDSGKSIKKNLAQMQLRGMKVIPQIYSFFQQNNVLKQETKSFLVQDDKGIFVFARQSAKDNEPTIQEKYYILKFPISKGASWQQEAEGLILRDTIESIDASVQVPAGSFNNCLVMKKLYIDPKNPEKTVQESVFWFAPDVGNVKVITRHPQRNMEIVQDLVSVKK